MSFFNGKHAVGVGFRLWVLLSWPICYLTDVHMGFLLWMLAAVLHRGWRQTLSSPVLWRWQGTAFLSQLLYSSIGHNFYKYKDKTDIFTTHTDINNYVEGRDLGLRMGENTIAFVARSLEKLGIIHKQRKSLLIFNESGYFIFYSFKEKCVIKKNEIWFSQFFLFYMRDSMKQLIGIFNPQNSLYIKCN